MNTEKFHVGRQIGRVLGERRMMKCVLANKLGVSESTAAHLTSRENIDVRLLQRIGKVLRYNFFKHYPVEEETGEVVDKDRIIAEQGARIAALELEVGELKMMEMRRMKENYDDLRQANKILLASIRPASSMKAAVLRKGSPGKGGEKGLLFG